MDIQRPERWRPASGTGPRRKSWEEILSVLGDGKTCTAGVELVSGALTAVVAEAERRGLQEVVLRGGYVGPSRALVRMFPAEMRMDRFAVETIRRMIRGCIDHGLSPATVRKSYLRVLHLAFGEAKLHSPVPQAREECKHLMRYSPPIMPWLEPEQIRSILHRIRTYRYNCALRCRDKHADLITLMAYTGIRSGEFSRVLVQDVDLERRVLHVRKAKVRSRPREIPLRGEALKAAERLVRFRPAREALCTTRNLNAMFNTWRKRLNEPNLNGRALRHSYATGLLLTGATLPETRDLIGHSHSSTETQRYLHSAEAHRSKAAERLAEAFEGGRLPDVLPVP